MSINALIAVPLLLLGLFGAPLVWPMHAAGPDLALHFLTWVAATAGTLLLTVAPFSVTGPRAARAA